MNIKQKYRERILKNEYTKIKRAPVAPKREDIKKVGIIWHPSQKEAVNYLRNFFKQEIVRTFCVFDKISNPPDDKDGLTITDLNWWGLPKNEKINNFLSVHFDVLLNITPKQNFILNYLTALTNADFKIGSSKDEQNYFDLNIHIKENQSALFLAEQQIFYLSQLNKKQNK